MDPGVLANRRMARPIDRCQAGQPDHDNLPEARTWRSAMEERS